MMRISFSAACKQPQPLVNFPGGINMEPLFPPLRLQKEKVVVVMGATGTGKSKLSIDLATRIPAEIINSDKMQVFKGLDIVTNKVTEEECLGVPHHLLSVVGPYDHFSASDFRHHATTAVDAITRRGRLPIIAGGSNSYIKALVHDDIDFQEKYECCFLWVDVSLPSVLDSFVSKRVDQMLKAGLVDEVREFFDPNGDYTLGIKRAIGVPEMDEYFRNELIYDDEKKAKILDEAIEKIKENTCKLARRQLQNIRRLKNQLGCHMHRLDATDAFLKRGTEAEEAWENLVAKPSTLIVNQFLYEDDLISSIPMPPPPTSVSISSAAAVSTAIH
ncbi:RNA processing factor [Lithospermum erythrorhizon]|uniref:adenylate dimethylallyltransferase (ADP/ATP-dependent) n=1 Tax=Lithospermum erythrorhizon TaxID=34254 RepID=A0AAV3RXH7_LITER